MKKSLVTDSAGWCFSVYSASTRTEAEEAKKKQGANNYLLIIGVYCTRLFGHDTGFCRSLVAVKTTNQRGHAHLSSTTES